MTPDQAHLLMDGGILLVTCFGAWNSSKMKLEIMRLKLWIAQNCVLKKDANISVD